MRNLILIETNEVTKKAYIKTLIAYNKNLFTSHINLYELSNEEIGEYMQGVLMAENRILQLRLQEQALIFLKLKIYEENFQK